jgi:hypothetical protein
VCFSPEADLIGGVAICTIGIDVVTHLRGRREYLALAALPLMLGSHQLVESLVWWGTSGSVSKQAGTVALWTYLLFAFVLLPTYVPWAVWRIEPAGTRRRLMAALTLVGVGVSLALLVSMIVGPVEVIAHAHHLAYYTSLRAGNLIIGLYLVTTCGAFLLSGQRVITWFGIVNLAAVFAIAVLTLDGFTSVWCAWAAVTSAAFATYVRQAPERQERPPRQRRWAFRTS